VLQPIDDEEVPPEALEHAAAALAAVAEAAQSLRPGTSFDRRELGAAAVALAQAVERLSPEEWGGPRGEAALHGVHMGVHHLRGAQAAVSRR
jgi:hypothetical protein